MPDAPAPCTTAPGDDWTRALQRPAEVSRKHTRLLVAAMAALHLGAGWALLQVPAVRQAVLDTAPLRVALLAPPVPQPPPAPPPRTPARLPAQPPSRPSAVLAAPAPLPAAAFTVPPPVTPAMPLADGAPAALPAPPVPPAPPPPARRLLAATAVRYLVQPPVEVPRASRRAGESGVVWLRVVVDAQGLPAQVRVQRSSGHARLDEQATWAMRQARFQPHTEDGRPIEVEVVAPIEYPLE